MTVVIIDYGSGNLHSVAKAFECQSTKKKGAYVRVTNKPEEVASADRVVLPGVGSYGHCKEGLSAIDGLIEALEFAVLERVQPFLGICVGMQLMSTLGLEHVQNKGLNWIPGVVRPISVLDKSLKIPHMGWNGLETTCDHPIFDDLGPEADVYFVHSFHFEPDNDSDLLATVEYGDTVTAAVGRDNLIGTQFHPEKSQGAGLIVINNFLRWYP
ncbi:MAG: imidazole glycerol phosphate synthase subunit HisH [Rhodospirillaceae bacterium]|nr:imidazole glycerol phosphate synthase subunit HisH [Rhodospirillaceae bacterium]